MTLGWILLSCLIVLCALGVVLSRHPVSSAISLLVGFMGIAILYLALGAEFVAVVQILVYAGGILVLYLFGIMLVDSDVLRLSRQTHSQAWPVFILVLALFLWGGHKLYHSDYALPPQSAPAVAAPAGNSTRPVRKALKRDTNTQRVARVLYGDYLYAFEAASVLLLVAVVGGVFLAKKEL